jgi:ribulose-phosphate 3-epimerase
VLTFHVETCPTERDARDVIATFRDEGVPKVGVSLNPDCPVERVLPLLDAVDLVLVMSVFAGFGGQRFLPEVLAKTRAVRASGFAGFVEMDGGLNAETVPQCAAAGTDVFVSGSSLFGAPDMAEMVRTFRLGAERARKERMHAS